MLHTLHAVKFLVMGPLILAVLVVVNVLTSPGHWWVQWAALGIGIAWLLSLLRVIRTMVILGGLAALVAWIAGQRRGNTGAFDPFRR